MIVAPAVGVEALPSKTQSKLFPLLVSLQASVPDGPLTLNRATSPPGFTVSVADWFTDRLPVIVTVVADETADVDTVNVPLVAPAAIVTLPGTLATPGLLLESVTTAP